VLTKTIYNEPRTEFPYRQEECFSPSDDPNSYPPGETGTTSNVTEVNPGCMIYVDLGTTPRAVTRVENNTWASWGTYGGTLYFLLPVSAAGIPFTFNIIRDNDCESTSLTFVPRHAWWLNWGARARASTYRNERYSYEATPIPAANEVTITAKQNEEYLGKATSQKASQPLAYTVEVYELTTGTRKILQQNVAGSLTNRINIATLRPGYYILHISDGQTSQKIKIYKE
jgi:hypothetical protein